MTKGLHCPTDQKRAMGQLEAVIWVVGWLVSLIGLLAYIYFSEQTSLWVWAALLLLALVSPTASAYQRALGTKSGYQSG